MKSIKKLFLLLVVAVAVPVASCVNEPMSSEEGYGAGEVAALQEQAASVNASVEHVASVEVGFGKYLNELGAQTGLLQAKAQMAALAATSESMEAHSSYLGTGVSRLEGTLATLSQQKELAQAVGAFEGSLAALDSKESKAAYDKHIKNQIEILCDGAQNWIGKSFAAYFTALRAEAKMAYMSEAIDRALNDQKTSVEGLISDVEAGIRSEEDADELYSLSEDIDGNSNDSEELVSVITEITCELETECEGAIKSVLATGKYDSSSLKTLTKSASAVVKASEVTLNDLINRVAACEAQIEDILQRLSALEASLDVIQSVTFVPEYATGSAVALYTLESTKVSDPASPYVGYSERTPADNIELNYLVRPAAVASALKTAFDNETATLKVFGYYANGIQLASVSSANAIDFAIQSVTVTNSAQGLIKVTVSHDLDDAFYFKGKGAKCAFSITSGKTDLTSKFVDLVPKDKSGNVYVESIKLSEQKVTFDDGETYQLSATVSPSNATNAKVTWSSSNSEIVTIDQNGKMTALDAGEVTITATTQGTDEWGFSLSATCAITVQEAIKLSGPAYVEMGKTAEILLDYPSDLIIDSKEWWIDYKKYPNGDPMGPTGTIDDYGIVKPSSWVYLEETNTYDTLFVKCQVNETVLTHPLKVIAKQPTAVKITALDDDVNNVTLKLGNTLDLSASVYPDDVASSGLFRVVYTTDAQNVNIAQMNSTNGLVTPKSPGSAYMRFDISSQLGFYYLAPGKDVVRRTVRVDVEPYWVKTMSFAQNSYELAPGATMTVTPVFTSDADGHQPDFTAVKWSSSNKNIATVDENTGLITAGASANGTCTITATTTSEWAVSGGGSKSASFSLTVKAASIYSEPGWYVYKDGTVSSTYTYSSTNPVVGIVVAAANMAAGDNVLANDYPECSNGFAVGLNEYNGAFGSISVYDTSHADNILYHFLENNGIDPNSTNSVNGYALTSACMNYCTTYAIQDSDIFGSSGSIVLTARETDTPSGMSSWYVPSYYEMVLIHNNLDDINTALNSINADPIKDGYYWSSQCRRADPSSTTWHDMVANPFSMSTGTWYQDLSGRTETYYVRVVFAF